MKLPVEIQNYVPRKEQYSTEQIEGKLIIHSPAGEEMTDNTYIYKITFLQFLKNASAAKLPDRS